MSKSLVRSASSSLESTVPSLPEPEAGSDKKTDEQPEPARVYEAPQVLKRDPGKIPKWLKLPGSMKLEESSSPAELHRKADSFISNALDVDTVLKDVNRRLARYIHGSALVSHKSICDLNFSLQWRST